MLSLKEVIPALTKDFTHGIIRVEKHIYINPKKEHKFTFIWMHGLEDVPDSFLAGFNNPELNPFDNDFTKIILLCAPVRPLTKSQGEMMTSWYDIKIPNWKSFWGKKSYEELWGVDQAIESRDFIWSLIDQEPIPKNKVFLGGFSQGCCMSLLAGLGYKHQVEFQEILDSTFHSLQLLIRLLFKFYMVKKMKPLVGTTEFQQFKVRQWLDFASGEIEPSVIALILPVLGHFPINPAQAAQAHTDLNKFNVLEAHFATHKYLVGDLFTIADINLASYFQSIFQFLYGEEDRAKLTNLVRWFKSVAELPEFLDLFGRTRYAKKPFPALQFAAGHEHHHEKKEKKEKQPQQQQQQQQQKQEKPKKEAPAKKEIPKVEEEEEEKPKQATCEFDTLPPSTFNIDDWKRQFLASKDQAPHLIFFYSKTSSQSKIQQILACNN